MQPLDHAEAGPHRRGQQPESRGGADQGEALDRHRNGLRVRPVGDAHVDPIILHRGIEKLLQHRAEPVDLVDEQDVAGLQRREDAHQVARLLQDRPGGGAQLHAHLLGQQHRERGLAEAGRPEEEQVIELLAPAPGRVNRDPQ